MQQLPADAVGGFAAWVEELDQVAAPARLAWRYGDAGALMVAADGAGRDDWRQAALRVARRAAARSFASCG